MKIKNYFLAGALFLSLSVLFYSCNDAEDNLDEVTVDLTETNKNYLFNTSAVRSKARSNGVGGPIGFIFRLGNGGFTGGRSVISSSDSPFLSMRSLTKGNGSTRGRILNDGQDGGELPDCVVENYVDNEDGTYSYSIDFGQGCEVFGELFKGKLTEVGSYTDKTFKGKTTYEGFGSDFWEIDGLYTYDGTWDFIEYQEDSLFLDWSADFNYTYDLMEKYQEDDIVVSVSSNGSGQEKSDENGYTVSNQENKFTYSSGESYSSKVDEPLFMDYACTEGDVFVFVKGIESGSFTIENETESYSVNYGDGTCDNIITVTQNGETFTIDLGKEFDEFDEDSDDD